MVWTIKVIVVKIVNQRDEGEIFPNVHPHCLHLYNTTSIHWCNRCKMQVKGGKAYRCKACNFDLCSSCFAQCTAPSLECLLRSDKGVRPETPMTVGMYFYRLGRKIEWDLFAAAIPCLLISNGLSLLLPFYQGKILDAVVNYDKNDFTKSLVWYLGISVSLGLFGGFKVLLFNIIGRKLANTIRVKLYQVMIVQDVAFFDGNSSGRLTSRLTNDVSFMATPIQSMLGSLLSNILLMAGIVSYYILEINS